MPTTTLLVAHPKPVIRAGLRSMLTDSQVKIVEEASDAPTTFTLAKKHKPHVVLLDAAIPGGDAFELAGRLLKALPATKVVFVTEIDNPTYTARARAAGAANCLLMGFSQRDLVAAIENAAAGMPAAGAGNSGRITASLAAREKGPALDAGLTPRSPTSPSGSPTRRSPGPSRSASRPSRSTSRTCSGSWPRMTAPMRPCGR